MIKDDAHVFQGTKRDVAMSRQQPQFLWEAHNIRILNKETGKGMSIVNEKGNTLIDDVSGYYVGHCIIENHLVIFTHNDMDRIYVLTKDGDDISKKCLYEGNLGFSLDNPIETLASFETDMIQKVYWVDGVNQPRVVNIMSNKILDKDNGGDTQFDFVREVELREKVTVNRILGEGMFSPGTIQYAISYYNLYGQQTNIVYTTPLQYIASLDRGVAADEHLACSFKITIENVDRHFDYLRIYSVQHTSVDTVPLVKRVADIEITEDEISFIDKGTQGNTMTDAELKFVGGTPMITNTLTSKDAVLFLGGLDMTNRNKNIKECLEGIIANPSLWSLQDIERPAFENELDTGTYYSYTPKAIESYKGGFKTNESYRIGIQAQTSNGIWTAPVFIADEVLSTTHPQKTPTQIQWHTKQLILNLPDTKKNELKNMGVVKLRMCVVFPARHERDILYQGIVNSTVYENKDRQSETKPYALSSWFFRPATYSDPNYDSKNASSTEGSVIQHKNGERVFTGKDRGAEMPGYNDNENNYRVDENFLTFHSPDVEFDDQAILDDLSDFNISFIGAAFESAVSGDMMLDVSRKGAETRKEGVYISNGNHNINGGLVTQAVYECTYDVSNVGGPYKIPISLALHPWHREKLINETDDTPAVKINTKVISNLKFFGYNCILKNSLVYGINSPEVFRDDEVTYLRMTNPLVSRDNILYQGNVDDLLTTTRGYKEVFKPKIADVLVTSIKLGDQYIPNPTYKEPVRMRYKSTPHIAFSLKSPDYARFRLQPLIDQYEGAANGDSFTPSWINEPQAVFIDYIVSSKEILDTIFPHRDSMHAFTYFPTDDRYQSPNGGLLLWKSEGGDWKPDPAIEASVYAISSVIDSSYLGTRLYSSSDIPNECKELFDGKVTFGMNTVVPNNGSHTYVYYRISSPFFETTDNKVFILEFAGGATTEEHNSTGDNMTISRDAPLSSDFHNFGAKIPYLWLCEFTRKDVKKHREYKFGGKSEGALRQNLWLPASEPVRLDEELKLPIIYGDTWYVRYDCFKTYPWSLDDINQVIEIGSFLVETRMNLDGRTDLNRGLRNNTAVHPRLNFNKFNDVYSQSNNFYNYRILANHLYDSNYFPSRFTWSLEKQLAGEIDLWTQLAATATYELDGNRGKISKIVTVSDELFCLQDKAISQILYNSRVQIPTSDGVPIEISNSKKLEGTRTITSHVGCQNKWSVCSTPSCVYFADGLSKGIYRFDGKSCEDLTTSMEMSSWASDNTSGEWKPKYMEYNGIRAFYDKNMRDVYFVPGKDSTGREALAFNETLGQFTSFYNYEGTPAMFSWEDGFYSLWPQYNGTSLYKNFDGEYNNFYGVPKPFSISFISNAEPTITKVFDNLEYRADVWYDSYPELINDSVFNQIRVENEYQDTGFTDVSLARQAIKRIGQTSDRYKFRVWRMAIPRNKGTRERIRNPWTKITLKRNVDFNNYNLKMQLHDIVVKYSI